MFCCICVLLENTPILWVVSEPIHQFITISPYLLEGKSFLTTINLF